MFSKVFRILQEFKDLNIYSNIYNQNSIRQISQHNCQCNSDDQRGLGSTGLEDTTFM